MTPFGSDINTSRRFKRRWEDASEEPVQDGLAYTELKRKGAWLPARLSP